MTSHININVYLACHILSMHRNQNLNYLSPNNLEQRIEALALMKGDAKNKDYEVEEAKVSVIANRKIKRRSSGRKS